MMVHPAAGNWGKLLPSRVDRVGKVLVGYKNPE